MTLETASPNAFLLFRSRLLLQTLDIKLVFIQLYERTFAVVALASFHGSSTLETSSSVICQFVAPRCCIWFVMICYVVVFYLQNSISWTARFFLFGSAWFGDIWYMWWAFILQIISWRSRFCPDFWKMWCCVPFDDLSENRFFSILISFLYSHYFLIQLQMCGEIKDLQDSKIFYGIIWLTTILVQ